MRVGTAGQILQSLGLHQDDMCANLMTKTFATVLLVLCCVTTHAADTSSPQEALAKAEAYLWNAQREDGSWRSEQYAVMRSGQSLTPFVLHTLLATNDSLSDEQINAARRSIQFIVDHLDKEGALGKADPDILEYPVYSTAYAVLALEKWRSLGYQLSDEERFGFKRMQLFLQKCQFNHTNGFTHQMPAYGGWGFDKAQELGQPGHMDLAHTRRAITAVKLTLEYTGLMDSLYAGNTKRFLAVVQKRPDTLAIQPLPEGVERPKEIPFDGGFYFSPVVLQANKGRLEKKGNYWQSYATATCDGILALLAAGVPKDDERVVAATKWLGEHTNIDYPQGIPTDYPEPWGEALQFYHYAVRAEVYDALDFPEADKLALAEKVAALQHADGSFVNGKSPLMKEDEPLLSTALAVVALSHYLE
jgi:hypothetical protein